MCIILALGCAADEHSETFDLYYPEQSESLHNELQHSSVLRSPLQAVTTPIGTVCKQLPLS